VVFSKKIFVADSNEIAVSYSGIGRVPVIDPICWCGSQKNRIEKRNPAV
jgi:hypothetical protein